MLAMSRNKENLPANSHSRVNGTRVGQLGPVQSDDFFTDSILESDATQSSRIPTPRPQKPTQAKSRRPRSHRNKPYQQQSKHKASASESSVPRLHQRGLQPALPIRRAKSPSPLRTASISTPPSSRNRLPLVSPHADVRSPPPRELPDVYQQIADEEDLAATEREFSDQEGDFPEDSEDEQVIIVNPPARPSRPTLTRSTRSPSSRASTPTQHMSRLTRENPISERTETMSEPTGMSFLAQLSDPKLAAKLTPHVQDSAKDRAKLREVWSAQKPVAFSKVSSFKANGAFSSHQSSIPTPPLRAFSKAIRPRTHASQLDPLVRRGSLQSDGSVENYIPANGDWLEDESPLKSLPINTRVERDFGFERNHGLPPRRGALTEQNLEQQNRVGRSEGANRSAPSSLASHQSVPALQPTKLNPTSDYIERAQKIRESLLGTNRAREKPAQGQDESHIDWAAAAADVPLPAAEESSNLSLKNDVLGSSQKQSSPEKTRKWDLDFTGHSLQISESPPVRSDVVRHDQPLGREIENLYKKGLTTSRLGEIRERHSQEHLRSGSRSPQPRSTSARSASVSSEHKRSPLRRSDDDVSRPIGEIVPDTPIVIYRSSSHGSNTRNPIEKEEITRNKADDVLQRFARAMSSTPKSSPAIPTDVRQVNADTAVVEEKVTPIPYNAQSGQPSLPLTEKTPAIAQTPKVVGAWTDTILPETVKTVKQVDNAMRYTQTPHVSAGGWVDTPAPVEVKRPSTEMTPITEEIPEELMDGIVQQKPHDEVTRTEIIKEEEQEWGLGERAEPKVGLAGILDRAKQRLISQDITTAPRDNDTLNLGNETIESLQDLLFLDNDDITTLSRVLMEGEDSSPPGDAQAEVLILERIGMKLDRLCTNIHEARKGISQLEHQVSQPQKSASPDTLAKVNVCPVCFEAVAEPAVHAHNQIGGSKLLPSARLALSLPIPLLFYPRNKVNTRSTQYHLPRPTPLGCLTIAVWTWYLVESIMCELYARPAYAERYIWPAKGEREPEFPFVLPTMLYRWAKIGNVPGATTILLGWTWTIFRALYRIIGMSLGWTDGFASATFPDGMATSALAPAAGIETDASMMNDEYV